MNKPSLQLHLSQLLLRRFFHLNVSRRRKNQNKFPYSQQNFPIYSILGFILTNFCYMIHEHNKQYSTFLADITLKIYTYILQFFFFSFPNIRAKSLKIGISGTSLPYFFKRKNKNKEELACRKRQRNVLLTVDFGKEKQRGKGFVRSVKIGEKTIIFGVVSGWKNLQLIVVSRGSFDDFIAVICSRKRY